MFDFTGESEVIGEQDHADDQSASDDQGDSSDTEVAGPVNRARPSIDVMIEELQRQQDQQLDQAGPSSSGASASQEPVSLEPSLVLPSSSRDVFSPGPSGAEDPRSPPLLSPTTARSNMQRESQRDCQ